MAEGAGFEPAIRLPVYTLSRRAPSTARPPLRAASRCRGGRRRLPKRPGPCNAAPIVGSRGIRVTAAGAACEAVAPHRGGRRAMANTIRVTRIAGALGADISGVDLSRPLSDVAIGEIRAALLDNLVIFLHDQRLSPEQQLDFGRRFGELQVHEFVGGTAAHPEIIEVRKEPQETRNFGGGWHTDVSYLERPALGSVLYAREVPEFGGDTMFANQCLAYETLSDGRKSLLGGMRAVHSARKSYGLSAPRRAEEGKTSMGIRFSETAHGEVEHPVVRTHVETGRKALYVNGAFTLRFK